MTIPVQLTVDTPYMVGPVHCYTMECDDGLVLFDTGPPTEQGRRFLQQAVDVRRLRHVIVTHCHIDHYGQAAWLATQPDVRVYLPYRDVRRISIHEERMMLMYELLARMGFNRPYLDTLRESFQRGALFPPFPESFYIAEKDLPSQLNITPMPCPGHSQTDLVYYGENWAVTGDTLLRGIFQSPLLDIDTETGGRFNNYRAYCESIVRLAGLEGKKILPGHRQHVDSVQGTIHFYISKMLQRVRQLKPHIGDNSVATIIARVFPEMKDPFHIYLKASEIVFMRDFLENPEPMRDALNLTALLPLVEEAYEAVATA